ncbi:MAG: ABC transporter ATP-binding protein [Bacteroidales bacterium]|nr:ABC transporter ATP-binding protein [Bacteroidales bacterium]
MENIIECNNLTHYYGKRKIYENLSFSVPKGRILGLLGKNGTGKTTSINILSGYLKPKEGECLIFGENIQTMAPSLRQNIGLLIEGHVQYQFMNIQQIERFYSAFFPKWKKDAYYDLMGRLKVAPKQKISKMSCGQRSQVALGLILAQDPELLILDDFSLGLDPGYRRLFVDYLREYADNDNKTIFLTSHIIQDMERLIDDCIIMDYGKILIQQPVNKILDNFRQIKCIVPENFKFDSNDNFYNPSLIKNKFEVYSFLNEDAVRDYFNERMIPYSDLSFNKLNLEDAFIGLTGKY